MPVKWTDLQDAFMASDPWRDARSWINAQTSAVRMSFAGGEHGGPPPDDEDGWHQMPDPRELDLKQELVWAFVADACPALQDDVRRCFSRRGGWRAFKHLLDRRNLLDRWHRYEEVATRRALLAWAAERGIDVIELPLDGDVPKGTI